MLTHDDCNATARYPVPVPDGSDICFQCVFAIVPIQTHEGEGRYLLGGSQDASNDTSFLGATPLGCNSSRRFFNALKRTLLADHHQTGLIGLKNRHFSLIADRQYATLANAIVSVGFTPNGTHFEPQRAS